MRANLPLIAALLLIACAGCVTSSGRIPFCWSSDHHLLPEERTVVLRAPPGAVLRHLEEWVKSRGGGRVGEVEEFPFTLALHPEASKLHAKAIAIAEPFWRAYEERKRRDWKGSSYGDLRGYVERQVVLEKSSRKGHLLTVKLGDRVGRTFIVVQAGTTSTYIPGTDGYPGVTVTTPALRAKEILLPFHSLIRFHVVPSGGGTRVHAQGVPVEGENDVPASYERKIGGDWWPAITGREEASFVKDALLHLIAKDGRR
jgi:hypothetical protein